MEDAGQSQISTTMNIYGHILDSARPYTAKRMNDLLESLEPDPHKEE
jgi:hypothetical protein